MKIIISSIVLLVTLLISPVDSLAYFTTDQKAYRINDQLALFQIDYSFGLEDKSVYLPVRAARDQAWGTKNKMIGFEVLKDGKITSEGEAIGVVKGPVLISVPNSSNEQYVAPAGRAIPMQFFVILQIEPSATTSRYAIQVTDLPFYVGEKEEYQKLNPSELKYYKTPSINLNRNLGNN